MALTKCNVPSNVIGSLATRAEERGLTTQEFKDKFDEMPEGIKQYINEVLTEEIDAHIADYLAHKEDYETHKADNNAHGIGDIDTRLSSLEETHGLHIYSSLTQIGSSSQDDLEGIFSKMPSASLLSFQATTSHSVLLGLESTGHYITIRKFGDVFASVQAINRTTGVLKINSRIESGFIGWKTIG